VRAALITGARQIELVEVPEPHPAPGGVVVDIRYCGVCGTDVGAYRTGMPSHPSLFGHEWTGTVRDVGDEAGGLAPGDRVVVAVRAPCGVCPDCAAGRPGSCRAARAMLLGRDPLAPPHGGFAPALAVAAERLVRVHPQLSDEEAALIEPASVAHRGVRRSGVGLGDVAVVQGAGPIGLLTLQFARAAGAATVVVIEPDPGRRAAAREVGADLVLAPGDEAVAGVLDVTGGAGGDVVFECAGHPPLLQAAVDLTRHGGVTAMLGYIEEAATIDPSRWLGKDITMVASVGFARQDQHSAMSLIADGRVRVSPLHSRTVNLEELGGVLQELAAGRSSDTKVLVDPH
jgi:(R,R)-butanediol dehydrogenase/meso-butanediol dehydrogenase/diacetyl reductase